MSPCLAVPTKVSRGEQCSHINGKGCRRRACPGPVLASACARALLVFPGALSSLGVTLACLGDHVTENKLGEQRVTCTPGVLVDMSLEANFVPQWFGTSAKFVNECLVGQSQDKAVPGGSVFNRRQRVIAFLDERPEPHEKRVHAFAGFLYAVVKHDPCIYIVGRMYEVACEGPFDCTEGH